MAEWVTQLGNNMPVIGQPSMMECWVTCYQMMLKAHGIMWSNAQIESKLIANGFANAKQARVSGISDEELAAAGNALKMGMNTTASINTVTGLANMLKLCGPLWVAGRFPDTQGVRHKHVVLVIGVDEAEGKLCMINPWVGNMWDTPSKGWIYHEKEFKPAIKYTLSVPGSVQYCSKFQAFALTAAASAGA